MMDTTIGNIPITNNNIPIIKKVYKSEKQRLGILRGIEVKREKYGKGMCSNQELRVQKILETKRQKYGPSLCSYKHSNNWESRRIKYGPTGCRDKYTTEEKHLRAMQSVETKRKKYGPSMVSKRINNGGNGTKAWKTRQQKYGETGLKNRNKELLGISISNGKHNMSEEKKTKWKTNHDKAMKGRKRIAPITENERKNHSLGGLKMWQNYSEEEKLNITKKRMMNRKIKMSRLEKLFSQILQLQNLPYESVSEGGFIIGTKAPDFKHTKNKKICIEVFHPMRKIQDYGSVENYIKVRSEYFAQYGWKTLFFTEDEIMNNLIEVIRTIKESGGD